jgi:hypothetical protein
MPRFFNGKPQIKYYCPNGMLWHIALAPLWILPHAGEPVSLHQHSMSNLQQTPYGILKVFWGALHPMHNP